MILFGCIIGFVLIFLVTLFKNLLQLKRKGKIEYKLRDIQRKLK
ncbi:hypothetical protein [Staphylococcus phage vB_SurM-PSU4]|nr:hypothetical protein [Staphylococcus phage vB_SurM-PSU4]